MLSKSSPEIDPAVFTATEIYFNLSSSHLTSVNLLDGSVFVSELATLSRVNITDPSLDSETLTALERLPKWDFVVQDCFTGGSVPGEMFTKEFWEDLGEMVAEDGLIAMVRPLLIISAGVDRKLEFCRTEDEQSLKSGISNLNICIPTVQGLWGWI